MLNDRQIKLLMLMHEVEEAMVHLNEIFNDRFPEHKNVWETLIVEEKEHAEAVRRMYRLTYDSEVLFRANDLKIGRLQLTLDFILSVCEAGKRGQYSARQAISITYGLEHSLIENKLFTFFDASLNFTELLDSLQRGTKKHLQLVSRAEENYDYI